MYKEILSHISGLYHVAIKLSGIKVNKLVKIETEMARAEKVKA